MNLPAKVRYRSMYITSAFAGYLLAGIMTMCGARWITSPRVLVVRMARRHAVQAARKEGEYLAPITFALILASVTCLVVFLIRALP